MSDDKKDITLYEFHGDDTNHEAKVGSSYWKFPKEEALTLAEEHDMPPFMIELIHLIYKLQILLEELIEIFCRDFKKFVVAELFGQLEHDLLNHLCHQPERINEFMSKQRVDFRPADVRIFSVLQCAHDFCQERHNHPDGLFHIDIWSCYKRHLDGHDFTQSLLGDIYREDFDFPAFTDKYDPLVETEAWQGAKLTELIFLIRKEGELIALYMSKHPKFEISEDSDLALGCKKIFYLINLHHEIHHRSLCRNPVPDLTSSEHMEYLKKFEGEVEEFSQVFLKMHQMFHKCEFSVAEFINFILENLEEIFKEFSVFFLHSYFRIGSNQLENMLQFIYYDHVHKSVVRKKEVDLSKLFHLDTTESIDLSMKYNKKLCLQYYNQKHMLSKTC